MVKRHLARQSANRRWSAFRTYCFTGALIVVVLTLPGLAFAADAPNPHTSSSPATAACDACHVPHVAEGPFLPTHKTQQDLCFGCHGPGSTADVQSELIAPGVRSSHPSTSAVPGEVTCSSCHTPHLGPAENNPSSIRVSSEATSGAAVCSGAECHPDVVATISAGHASVSSPESPAKIPCLGCHEPHASTIEGLIRSQIRVGSTSMTVTSQADLCRACHSETSAGTVSQLTKHANASESTTVALAGDAGSACSGCHNPHGGMVKASGDGLCLGCHAAAGLSYPTDYSFRGSEVYESSGHTTLTSSNNYRTIGSESSGFGVWESADATPTPFAPGAPVSVESSTLVLVDGVRAAAGLPTTVGQPVYQLYQLPVGAGVDDLRTARVQWAGFGAREAGYSVFLSVWNVLTNSWDLRHAEQMPEQGFVEFSIDPSTSLDSSGSVWVLAEAICGSDRSLTTDYVGLALAYGGPVSSGSCTVCHAMHGSSVDGTMTVGQVLTNEGRLCTGDGAAGCHGLDPARGSDVARQLTASTDPRAHHDVMPEAQAATGSRIGCSSCHNPHANSVGAPYSDPDDISVPVKIGLDVAITSLGYAYMLVGAAHDAVPPVISKVTLESAGTTRAVLPLLRWETDEPATSWVEWGLTSEYDSTTGSDALERAHSVSVDAPLEPGLTYYYRVSSVDALGNVRHSEEATYAAIVPPAQPIVSSAILDRDTMQLVPLVLGIHSGPGPLSLTATSTAVPSPPDGHGVEYQFELQTLVPEPAWHSESDWLVEPSWEATIAAEALTRYRLRVRARDAGHPFAVSEWSSPSEVFAYAITAEGEVPAPPASWDTSMPTDTTWLAEHEPPRYFDPNACLINSDLMTLCVVGIDGETTYVAPDSGWETASSSAEDRPIPADFEGSPSVGASVLASVAADDGDFWHTGRAADDGSYNWQVVRFDLSAVSPSRIKELTYVWNGHGEPTNGYPATVQTWNAETGSWTVEAWRDATEGKEFDVSKTVAASDSTTMCLRCHDGLPPKGVVFPAGVSNVGPSWANETGDFHGANAGTGFGIAGLKPPYARGTNALPCGVCHDSHGSGSIYHIAARVNGESVDQITSGNFTTLCTACHPGAVRNMHEGCATRCHNGEADHYGDISDLLPKEDSDCADCHGHGRSWTHSPSFSTPGCDVQGCHETGVTAEYPRTF